jgi:hypothetical protein
MNSTSRPNVVDYNLSELLDQDNTFMVPTYQRDYAWGEEQTQQLITDLSRFAESDELYYVLGQIILAPNASSTHRSYKYAVVDGQQRLTTLFLLFAGIERSFGLFGVAAGANSDAGRALSQVQRVLIETRSDNGNTLNRLRPCNQADFALSNLLDGKELDEVQPNTSAANIRDNFETLFSELRDVAPTLEKLTNLTTRILYNVFMFTAVVESEGQALSVFEKINNRGIPLNSSDLLKYLIFQNAKSQEFDIVNAKWALAGEALYGTKPNSIASVQYLMQALLQPETGEYKSSTDLDSEWRRIFAKNPSAFPPGAFVEEILRSAQTLSRLASKTSNELNSGLHAARYFNLTQHFPVALEMHKVADGDSDLYRSLISILDARVIASIFAGEGANKLYPVMWKWSHQLRLAGNGKTLNTYLGALDSSGDASRLLISSIESKFSSFDYGYSKDKKRIRFALAYIASYLEQRSKHENPDTSFSQLLVSTGTHKYDVDHIFARALAAAPTFDASNGTTWVNQIGNLCLLHASDNRSAGTVTPETKSKSYATSKLLATQMLALDADAPSLHFGSSQSARVAQLMRGNGFPSVENWGSETAEKLSATYLSLFVEKLEQQLAGQG